MSPYEVKLIYPKSVEVDKTPFTKGRFALICLKLLMGVLSIIVAIASKNWLAGIWIIYAAVLAALHWSGDGMIAKMQDDKSIIVELAKHWRRQADYWHEQYDRLNKLSSFARLARDKEE